MSKRKSDVLLFFEIKNESSGLAECKICHKSVSRGGKSHTTSNLKKHLENRHRNEFFKAKLNKKQKIDDRDDSENDFDEQNSVVESASDGRPSFDNFAASSN